MLAAKKMGLQVKKVSTTLIRLDRTPLPAIAISKNGEFFVLAQADGDKFLVHQPSAARPLVLSEAELTALWSGELILVASRASMTGDLAKFDFTWFIPAVVKYRRLLGEILLVSFALNLFTLVTPLFFFIMQIGSGKLFFDGVWLEPDDEEKNELNWAVLKSIIEELVGPIVKDPEEIRDESLSSCPNFPNWVESKIEY